MATYGNLLLLLIFAIFIVGVLVILLVILYKVYAMSRGVEESEHKTRRKGRLFAKKFGEKVDTEIGGILSPVKETFEREVRNHLQKLATEAEVRNEQMTKFIEDQQSGIVRESQFLIAKSLERINGELDEYHKNRLAEIDDQVRQIILSAAREVLGRSISLSEHEQLVREALDKAKKDKVFA